RKFLVGEHSLRKMLPTSDVLRRKQFFVGVLTCDDMLRSVPNTRKICFLNIFSTREAYCRHVIEKSVHSAHGDGGLLTCVHTVTFNETIILHGCSRAPTRWGPR
ncbi:unnamed protein product, partial [Ectocarpus sp. 12 AP-2014]